MDDKDKLLILATAKSVTTAIIKEIITDIEKEILKNTETKDGYKWVRVTHLKMALRGLRADAIQRLETTWGKTRLNNKE